MKHLLEMNEESVLVAFKAICNFVNDLAAVFGDKFKSLKLYKRLINHTQIGHDEAIKKHLGIFRNFCLKNRDAIYESDQKKMADGKLTYSDRVYIDMTPILAKSDPETLSVIWRHFLTISAILDPAGKAKSILKKNIEEKKEGADEMAFLTNIITKVENAVGDETAADPMAAITNMMQSGLFGELVGGIQNGMKSGTLNFEKMMRAVQTMVTSLGKEAGDDPAAQQAVGMVNNLVGTIQAGQAPDPSGLLSLVGGLASSAQPK